jgi:hypothetical protein
VNPDGLADDAELILAAAELGITRKSSANGADWTAQGVPARREMVREQAKLARGVESAPEGKQGPWPNGFTPHVRIVSTDEPGRSPYRNLQR